MVYSFFHPGEDARSLGTYMILDHIAAARARKLPYVYLGYWIRGSAKMHYKSRFQPLEALTPDGWSRLKSESHTEPQSHSEKFIATKSTKNTKERIARAARVITS